MATNKFKKRNKLVWGSAWESYVTSVILDERIKKIIIIKLK